MNKKYVIYSAIIGSYDNILQPDCIDNRFDYILFSDDIPENKIGIWEIKKINKTFANNTLKARYVKTNAFELLDSKYDFYIWIDANIKILSDYIYKHSLDLFEKGIEISSMWHNVRDCIYDEAFVVYTNLLEHDYVIYNWYHKLLWNFYPKHNGLHETNVLYIKNSNTIKVLFNKWWHCIKTYSKRDQLSFDFLLWKYNITCPYFMGNNTNTRFLNNDLVAIAHKNSNSRYLDFWGNEKRRFFYFLEYSKKFKFYKQIIFLFCILPFPNLSFKIVYLLERLFYRIIKNK